MRIPAILLQVPAAAHPAAAAEAASPSLPAEVHSQKPAAETVPCPLHRKGAACLPAAVNGGAVLPTVRTVSRAAELSNTAAPSG